MHNIAFNQSTLDILARVFPLKGAIVVGAGLGQGPWFDFLSAAKVNRVLLVEAQDDYAKQLERLYADQQGWQIKQKVLSSSNELATFYQLSSRHESGLLPAEHLKILWPNISDKGQWDCQTTTLDDLAMDLEANWLFVDCLPALPILKGAKQWLHSADLVVVRSLLNETTDSIKESSALVLDNYLGQLGFTCIGQDVRQHPMISHRIYLRDYAGALRNLQVQYLKQQGQIEQLQLHCDEQSQLVVEHQTQIGQVSKERDELAHQLEERQAGIESLEKKRDEQALLAQQRQQQLDLLNRQLEEAASLIKQESIENQKLQLEIATLKEKLTNRESIDSDFEQAGHQAKRTEEQPVVSEDKTPLFRISAKKNGDEEAVSLSFYPMDPTPFDLEGNLLRYLLETNTPGYLLTNPSGRFNFPPKKKLFDFKPDTAYLLTGRIAYEGFSPPVFWIFEYQGNRLVNKTSYPSSKGKVNVAFFIGQNITDIALGIRVIGEGTIDLTSSELCLDTGAVAEQAYFDYQEEISQVSRSEECKRTLFLLEDFSRLQCYMGPDIVLPDMHSWQISPDLGILIIRLIESYAYDAVIEFGSGVSTLVIAKAIEKQNRRHLSGVNSHSTRFLSFDHLEAYYIQTQKLLEQGGVSSFVDLCHAPLKSYTGFEGLEQPYYDCSSALNSLRDQISNNHPRILVFVDGPPAAIGPRSRFPALPVLRDCFADKAYVDLLLDDYIRNDERECVETWEKLLSEQGLIFEKEEFLKMEKQSCLLKIEAKEG